MPEHSTAVAIHRSLLRGGQGWTRAWVVAVILAVLAMPLAGATTAAASVPSSSITGPVVGGAHGRPYGSSLLNLRPWRYVESEYFASGTAEGGGTTAIPTPSTGSGPATYRTRILVRRPVAPATFNGTVLVEWLNVSSSQDYDADWSEGYREMLRGGYAYVGVSAQQIGVQSLKDWDPLRYGSLQHPGDGYAASMYAQVLQAVRHPNDKNPFAGLRIQRVIADGHSQSGINLHSFVDSTQAKAHLADGFLIRGDATTNFDFAHLHTPVLQYQSEAEIAGPVGQLQQRGKHVPPSPDSTFYRLWQVAGATHTGQEGADYLFGTLRHDYANQPPTWDENSEGRYDGRGGGACPSSLGFGTLDQFPQWYTLDAAIHALNRWIATGQAPATVSRIAVDQAGHIERDQHHNALGGVRDPVIDVPIATYHGDEGCPLSGVTVAFNAATLASLYPTHDDYLAGMRSATARAETARWLEPYDASDLLARATRSTVGG